MAKADITAERLRELLDYDPVSGHFVWRSGRYAGRRAGCPQQDGYRRLAIKDVDWREHRLAWLYVFGCWPRKFLDHINGDRADNRLSNLREATHAENQQNLKSALVRSKAGLLGVTTATFRNGRVAYVAKICLDRKVKCLGTFNTPELAHAAYVAAKRELHPFGTL